MLKKLVLGQIILLIFQGVSYFGCEIFQHHFHKLNSFAFIGGNPLPSGGGRSLVYLQPVNPGSQCTFV